MGEITIKDVDTGQVSDGYHTFAELYEHRIELFIALCRKLDVLVKPWKSRYHSDGSTFDGWFIMGISKRPGYQITYHLPERCWEETNFAELLDRAPEWDGHTSADVLQRLKKL